MNDSDLKPSGNSMKPSSDAERLPMLANLRLLSKYTFILCVACILINFVGVRVASALSLPVFIDCIGTIMAAALGGYIPAIIVGFFSNVINAIFDSITLYYGLLNALIGLAAAFLASRGGFRSIKITLLSIPIFTVIGGGLGSVMTWMLYGFNFGEGISQNLAYRLYSDYGIGKFMSQLIADMVFDLADKIIVVAIVAVLLRVLPQKLLSRFPLGGMYDRSRPIREILTTDYAMLSHRREAVRMRFFRRHSLRRKVAYLIILTSVVLGVLSVTIGYVIYQDTMLYHYTQTCDSVVRLMVSELDGDVVDSYLTDPDSTDYAEVEARLQRIFKSQPKIQYMYVYRITEAGCTVIFDLDTEELAGEEIGTVIGTDPTFEKYLPALYAGREIEPVISNDSYGWLLTVYHPVVDSNGECKCYAAADIDMQTIISDRYVFVSRTVSLLFGASIIIICFAIWYAQRRIVDPINAITEAAGRFAHDSDENRLSDNANIASLDINTGDEIENLCAAFKKTFADVNEYIANISEKNREIAESAAALSRLQNNVIISFAGMVENRDENTGGHIRRTAAYVEAIGRELIAEGKYADELNAVSLDDFVRAAPLHDIGKIKIPDSILNKPGRLTSEEFAVIKTHTTSGCAILEDAFHGIESEGYITTAKSMALSHHERWDGSGYPGHLSGEQIPLCARIMAIADVFDALVSRRAYKDAYSFDEALNIIRGESGSHFDPVITEAFLNISESIEEISELYK